jgi:hypothetical protein
MSIKSDALMAAFRKAPLTVSKNLRLEMEKGLAEVARQARQNHRFKSKSSNANRSIKHLVSGDGMEGKVYIDSGVAKYAEYQHEGTGRYGPKHRAYKVRAVTRKALYWVSNGAKNFVSKKAFVTIKGIRPDKFLYRAFAAQKPYLVARMNGAVDAALKMAGLKGVK